MEAVLINSAPARGFRRHRKESKNEKKTMLINSAPARGFYTLPPKPNHSKHDEPLKTAERRKLRNHVVMMSHQTIPSGSGQCRLHDHWGSKNLKSSNQEAQRTRAENKTRSNKLVNSPKSSTNAVHPEAGSTQIGSMRHASTSHSRAKWPCFSVWPVCTSWVNGDV